MAVSLGWCADYPDPEDLFVPFVETYWPYERPFLASSKYTERIARAAKLVGPARLKAFGKIDLDLARNLAPAAFMNTYDNRYFFSDRVDPRSLAYHVVYQDWSIPALALK